MQTPPGPRAAAAAPPGRAAPRRRAPPATGRRGPRARRAALPRPRPPGPARGPASPSWPSGHVYLSLATRYERQSVRRRPATVRRGATGPRRSASGRPGPTASPRWYRRLARRGKRGSGRGAQMQCNPRRSDPSGRHPPWRFQFLGWPERREPFETLCESLDPRGINSKPRDGESARQASELRHVRSHCHDCPNGALRASIPGEPRDPAADIRAVMVVAAAKSPREVTLLHWTGDGVPERAAGHGVGQRRPRAIV